MNENNFERIGHESVSLITLNNKILPTSETMRYVRIKLDQLLIWKDHTVNKIKQLRAVNSKTVSTTVREQVVIVQDYIENCVEPSCRSALKPLM